MIHGKPRFFKSKTQSEAENDYWSLLEKHVPDVPLDGPLEMSIRVVWPYLASHIKRKADQGRNDCIPHIGKPDLDNFAKMLIDALTKRRIITDDSRVFVLAMSKYYGPPDQVGIRVSIESTEGKQCQEQP